LQIVQQPLPRRSRWRLCICSACYDVLLNRTVSRMRETDINSFRHLRRA
jgi:hypothetical protein